jgi:hypothetical protein
MKELYHLKFEKLWLQFEAMCRETHEANQAKKYHDAYTNYDNMNTTTARGEYLDEGN